MFRLSLALLCVCTLPLAAASTVITGKLTGKDGQPIEKAHVHIASSIYEPPVKTVDVGKDGSYRIESDNTSPYLLLQFTGASHKMEAVPLMVEKQEPVQLDVSLQPNTVGANIESVTIIGDFNNYEFSSGLEMQKQADGTYAIDIPTANKTLSYQLIVMDGMSMPRSVNGTMYNDLVYDGGGDYRSVVAVANGKAHVVFEPKKMPSIAAPARIQFGAKSKYLEAFSLVAKEVEARKTAVMMLAQTSGEGSAEPGKQLKSAMEELAARIDKEQDDNARRYMLLLYLEYTSMTELSREKPNPIVERAFREIPPESPLWDYQPNLHYAFLQTVDSAKASDYQLAMLKASASPKIRRSMLNSMLTMAFYNGQEAESRRYYTMLLKEFPDSEEAKYARQGFNPDRAVQKGHPVPAFSVVSLDKEGQTYSNESLKGKYYLIDFWATWCGPCVREMDNLHKAYDEFKGKNFEIISLSFDGKPEDVTKFRGKKWAMPWLHAFVKGGFDSDLGKTFEVSGIPKPILIDPSGVIVASEGDLRGEQLHATLEKILGSAK